MEIVRLHADARRVTDHGLVSEFDLEQWHAVLLDAEAGVAVLGREPGDRAVDRVAAQFRRLRHLPLALPAAELVEFGRAGSDHARAAVTLGDLPVQLEPAAHLELVGAVAGAHARHPLELHRVPGAVEVAVGENRGDREDRLALVRAVAGVSAVVIVRCLDELHRPAERRIYHEMVRVRLACFGRANAHPRDAHDPVGVGRVLGDQLVVVGDDLDPGTWDGGRIGHLGELEDDVLRRALLGDVDVVEENHRTVAGDATVLGRRVNLEQVRPRRDRLVAVRSPLDVAEHRFGRDRTRQRAAAQGFQFERIDQQLRVDVLHPAGRLVDHRAAGERVGLGLVVLVDAPPHRAELVRRDLRELPCDVAGIGVEKLDVQSQARTLEKLRARKIDRRVGAVELDAVDGRCLERVAGLRGERRIDGDRVGLAQIEIALEPDTPVGRETPEPFDLGLDADRILIDRIDIDAPVGDDRDPRVRERAVVAVRPGHLEVGGGAERPRLQRQWRLVSSHGADIVDDDIDRAPDRQWFRHRDLEAGAMCR